MVQIAYDIKSKQEIVSERVCESLNICGFPSDILREINKYNREHPCPDGNAINITQTCIDALRHELKIRGV